LSIVRDLRVEFDWLGTVLQAYLKRTEADCEDFARSGARIRLCKGAYDEPASVAYREPSAVTESYLRCLRILMSGNGYPMIASHDPIIVAAASGLAAEMQKGVNEFEYQMLFGIRDAEQRRLADAGHHVRVYVPFGTHWYGYLVRRLAERPANLTFFLRALVGN
jgi:proline dehydrogenase